MILKNILDLSNNGIINLAAPTSDNDAATKKYVDDNIISDTNTWRNILVDGIQKLDTSIGNSVDFKAGTGITLDYTAGAITIAAAGGAGVTEAPVDGTKYLRKDAAWVQSNLFNHEHNIVKKETITIPSSGWIEDVGNGWWYRDISLVSQTILAEDDFDVTLVFANSTDKSNTMTLGFFEDVDRINDTTFRIKATLEFTIANVTADVTITKDNAPAILIDGGDNPLTGDTLVANTSVLGGLSGLNNQKIVNEYLESKHYVGTSAPISPNEGDWWFDTTPGVKQMYYYDDTEWVPVNVYV